MAAPSVEEKMLIQTFRNKVGDVVKNKEHLADDMFLIRWLRARDLSLEKAEEMLRNSMKWREENKVDDTMKSPVDPYFASNYPFDLQGRDKDGRPLLVLPLGKWDARMAVEDGKVDQLVGYFNFFFESVMKTIKETGKQQFTAIVDWDGYSFKQFANIKAAQTVLRMSAVYEAHYPEILNHCIFINTTSVFQLLWGLMRKILAERTVGKIEVFGTKRKEWEPAILRVVDISQIQYELREGMQISDEELQKLKEAEGFRDEEITSF